MATSFHIVQRTCHVRLFSDRLAPSCSGAGRRYRRRGDHPALGLTQSKEYAELEWPIDILIAVVWVAYAVVSSARSPSAA
jgi:cytochrome c oxidase cbb3-type subunit 1